MSSSRFTLRALLTREAGVKWSVVYESRGTSKKFSVIVLPLEGTSRSTSANGFATSFNNNCVTTLAQTSAGRVNAGKFFATASRHSHNSCGPLWWLDFGDARLFSYRRHRSSNQIRDRFLCLLRRCERRDAIGNVMKSAW